MTALHRLMRHPRPSVAPGICYGRTEVALEAGWEHVLESILPQLAGIDAVVTSPAVRCLEPAAWLAGALGIDWRADERLRELDFGDWEGRRWDDIDGPEARAWAADPLHRAPPGGESMRALQDRVLAALRAIEAAKRPCLLLTHGGPARVILSHCQGRDLADAFRFKPGFATLYRFTDQPVGE